MKILHRRKYVNRKSKLYRVDKIMNNTPMALFCKLFFTLEQ